MKLKTLERSQSKILQYAMPELLMVGEGNQIIYDSNELIPFQRHSEQWKISEKLMKEIIKTQ